MIKVFLAGEGKTELGGWASERPYRDITPAIGVLEALLRKVSSGWMIVDAVCWKDIRKYRAQPPMPAEVRNVLGVALQAQEVGADVLVFTRDRDRDENRERDVNDGIAKALNLLTRCPRIVGGLSIEAIEAWILALIGEKRGYKHARPRTRLTELGFTDLVTLIDAADLDRQDIDAPSLRVWLEQARVILTPAS